MLRYDHQMEAAEFCNVKAPSGVYDRVVDCVGSAESLETCVELLSPKEKLLV